MLDNRGVGRSCCLEAKAAYTTTIMAKDVLLLLVGLVPLFKAALSRAFPNLCHGGDSALFSVTLVAHIMA